MGDIHFIQLLAEFYFKSNGQFYDLGFLMQKSLMQKSFKSEKSGQLVQKAEMQKAVLPSKIQKCKILVKLSKNFTYNHNFVEKLISFTKSE